MGGSTNFPKNDNKKAQNGLKWAFLVLYFEKFLNSKISNSKIIIGGGS